MKQRKLIWQIFPAFLLILLPTVISVAWFGKASLNTFYHGELEKGLIARAYLAKPIVSEMLEMGLIDNLREYSKNSGRESNTRVTVVLPSGKVVADSNENPQSMELHHNRAEIIAALQGEVGKSLRYSRTLGQKMLYVAIPIFSQLQKDGVLQTQPQILAVLRMSVTADAIEITLKTITSRIALGLIIFAFVAVLASLLVTRNISKPLEEIKNAAERFSQGDFSRSMSASKGASASLEVATLATTMDTMAAQLNERIQTIESQHNELETVFSSMVEAVIALDRKERVININSAAADLLGIDRDNARGKIIQEVLRNFNLHSQIKQVLKTGISKEDEIVYLDSEGQKFLQTNTVSLNDNEKNVLGVLVVMNDVTKLRRLENVRRDFVANVSHELRTPITSIRGYVETLLDGAIDNRDDALQFLDTVLRQSERLNEIIEDLLALSRIEQEADHGQITLEVGSLCMVLRIAIETCEHRAEEEGVSISLECIENIRLKMNETLIEQAFVNLLVNAIRYSKKGDTVKVRAELETKENESVVKIRVQDTGIGISAEHLPRLFERFYRSDKARSRKHGGTGLGLAIVKHIVLAHEGRIEVESELGVGSTFTVTLPLDNPDEFMKET